MEAERILDVGVCLMISAASDFHSTWKLHQPAMFLFILTNSIHRSHLSLPVRTEEQHISQAPHCAVRRKPDGNFKHCSIIISSISVTLQWYYSDSSLGIYETCFMTREANDSSRVTDTFGWNRPCVQISNNSIFRLAPLWARAGARARARDANSSLCNM